MRNSASGYEYASIPPDKCARIQYERIGSDVTMQCGSLDNEASVTWKVNGTDVKARRREEGPRLILMEVNMSSNGLYSCFQNPDGQRRDQINLRVGQTDCELTPDGLVAVRPQFLSHSGWVTDKPAQLTR
ncbi:ciliary neurotrophic factor receptor subunit alpha-like protein [Labeo rohita]|uniref:Ciliary neurotrophic factor receptor subunit alpha-like protein n=1 Tax=Labeo rohita TaxID=84645 RepID=A0A498NBM1_LABRO|nr:ciliary neurotrophic factor receptor subunit alpha-like protein [Labeo rohita]